MLEVLADTGHADFAVREVRAAIAADRRVAGRLALWGRRLVGEAMTQSQAVIAEHDGLAELIIGGTGDLGGVARLIERITDAHTERMKALGLNPDRDHATSGSTAMTCDPPGRTAARSRSPAALSRLVALRGEPPAPPLGTTLAGRVTSRETPKGALRGHGERPVGQCVF